MLQAIKLKKVFENGKIAIDNLNISIGEGEIFCLLGANGAGKTTTIDIFLNFIEPTSGSTLINEIDSFINPLEAKKFVSYVGENVMLYENFTARQNLEFFSQISGKNNLTTNDLYMYLRKVHLQENAFELKLKFFSKGMRQKVGLTIAMAKDTNNILLDEPLSGLDPKAALEFLNILNELRNEGKSILICTHDIFRAKSIADRVGIMNEGRLVMVRTREEFLKENLESLYMNYVTEVID